MPSNELIYPKTESWKIFNLISRKYDLLNRLLSMGMDIRWRQKILQFIPDKSGLKLLDIATGTADVVISIVENKSNIHSAIGIDMAQKMLDIGQEKVVRRHLGQKITLQKADAQELPFASESFDLTTIAFGIRNMPDLRMALMEMYRMVKPGGRSLVLEFSIPDNFILRMGYIVYLRVIVPFIGFLFSGNYIAYKYLNQTIEQFPYGDRFCKILKQVGYKNVAAHPLLGGVATIYVAEK